MKQNWFLYISGGARLLISTITNRAHNITAGPECCRERQYVIGLTIRLR